MDRDGVTAYLTMTITNGATPGLLISRLNSTWTAVDGTNYTIVPASLWPTTGSLGQPGIEATNIFYYNGTYFLLGSTINVWASGINYYASTTASNPLSGWTFGANPFQSVAGGTPDYQTAYDTQTDTIINIGGRTSPCFIYVGDRYDVSNPSQGSSPTNTMQNWRPIILPITFPTPTSMSISWPASGQWNLDQSFPPVSAAPASPTRLATTGSGGAILSWTNNETTPHMLYLDRATDPGFTQNVVSEVLPMGTTSFSDTQVVVGTQYYYRVRAVNASGSSVSSPLSVTASNPSVLPTLQSFLRNLPPGDTVTWQGVQWRAEDLTFTLTQSSDPRLSLKVAVSGKTTSLLNADGSLNSAPLTPHKWRWGMVE